MSDEIKSKLVSQVSKGEYKTDNCVYIALKNLFVRYPKVWPLITGDMFTNFTGLSNEFAVAFD